MKKVLILTIIVILIPLLIIGTDKKISIENKIKYGSYNNIVVKVKRSSTGNIVKIPIEEYVIGVVAGEMPANFEMEALKSQAVASRTYVMKRIKKDNSYDVTDSTTNQVYIDYDQMKKKWDNNYDTYLNKIKKAVKETNGEAVLYDNKLIDALFFSTSNGYTESSLDVFSSDLPYLVSVESKWDKKESPAFSSTNEFTKKEFLYNLGLNIDSDIKIDNIVRTNSKRVKEITINNKKYTGREIRKIFGLKSTSFDIKLDNEKVIFNVNGFGHGVGLSQYGANGMAKEGYNYKQILTYYYKNCVIKKIN